MARPATANLVSSLVRVRQDLTISGHIQQVKLLEFRALRFWCLCESAGGRLRTFIKKGRVARQRSTEGRRSCHIFLKRDGWPRARVSLQGRTSVDTNEQETASPHERPVFASPNPKSRLINRVSAKHFLFFALGLMTLFVLYHNERFFLNPRSGTWKFFYPVFGKLVVHALGGATALVLGAFQFSTRLRQRRPAIHRLCGRCYIAGVLIAAPMAVYLSFTHGIRTMGTETTVQSCLWALTTVMALRAARKRNFDVHQQWAMRSYAVTLIFVVNRVILALPGAPTTDAGAERLTWTLLVCALIVPQMIINWPQLFRQSSR